METDLSFREAKLIRNFVKKEKQAQDHIECKIRFLENTVEKEKQARERAVGTVSSLKKQLVEGKNEMQRLINKAAQAKVVASSRQEKITELQQTIDTIEDRNVTHQLVQKMEANVSFREAKLIEKIDYLKQNFVKKEKQAQDHIECKIRCLENTAEKEKQARERAVGAVSSLKKQLVEGKNEMQRLINKAAQAEVVASSRQEKITELQQTIDTIEGSEDREDEICLKFSSDAHSDAESGSGRESDVSGRKLGLTQMVSYLDNSMSGPAGRVEDLLSKARKGLEKHVNNYLCVYLRKSDAEVKNRNYGLCKKINDLREKFPQKLIEAMHSLRDAGNAATHGRPVPNRTDAEFIMAEFTRLKILFDQKKNNDSHWY